MSSRKQPLCLLIQKIIYFLAFVEHEDTPPLLDLMMSIKGSILNDDDVFDDLVFFSAAVSIISFRSIPTVRNSI